MIGKRVLVRTFSAGVHFGTLRAMDGKSVELADSTRIWRWQGANTLSELSQKGSKGGYTRISERVPEIALTEAIEIIPCSPEAAENLGQSRWGDNG